MARLFMSGFEMNDPSSPSTIDPVGTGTIVTSPVRSGTYALTPPASLGGPNLTGVAGTGYYLRCCWYFTALPGADTVIMAFYNGTIRMAALSFTTTGAIKLSYGGAAGTTTVVATSSPVALNTWQRLELYSKITVGSTDEVGGRLNDVTIGSATALAITDTPATSWLFGNLTTATTDDLALNDSNGTVNNSWPGDGKVVLLRPVSDVAWAASWTLGTGTIISGQSGKTAVTNLPPLGVADLAAGSDVKQIRNAGNVANANYDAGMTSYTNAGVGALDTVNAVQCWVATAAPVVTSAKLGTVGIVSNPTVTNVALGAAGTAGAFWQGVAGGTYPAGWKWSSGTMTEAPTVTKGTQPVMRITQVTASTRIAVVCAMGIYVDYTPAAVPGKRSAHKNTVAMMRSALR